jgi:hypothetical protein
MIFPSFHFTTLTFPSHPHHNFLPFTSPFKHAVEMDSGVMMYIPSFIKIVSGIEKVMV